MTESRRARGVTLVELLIAVTISTVALASITYMLMASSRIAQGVLTQLHAGNASRSFYEHVAFNTRRAKRIVVAANGLSVQFTLTDNTVVSYSYLDADADPDTIMDNQVVFDPNVATTGGEETIVRGVTPGPDGWIFQPDTPRPILIMSFRIGDPSLDTAHQSNVFTGPGAQGVNVMTRITPRNLHLWGGG